MRFDCLPGSASGTNWANPANAITIGSGVAEYAPGTAGQNPLKVTGFIGLPSHEYLVNGVEVLALFDTADAFAPGGALGLFNVSLYEATLAQVAGNAIEAYDANDATYLTADQNITVIHDLGSSQFVTSVHVRWWNSNGLDYSQSLQHSNDGVSWTGVSLGAVSIGGSGAITNDQTRTVNLSARYWRWSQTNNVVAFGSTDNTRCVDFRVLDGSGDQIQPTPGAAQTPYDVEVALTLDGATAATGWRALTLDNTAVSHTFGSSTDEWGVAWVGVALNSDFGVLLRRANLAAGHGYVRVDFAMVSVWASRVQRSMRLTNLQRLVFGIEPAYGTDPASWPRQMNTLLLEFEPQSETSEDRLRGDTAHGPAVTHREHATGSANGTFDYIETPLIIPGCVDKYQVAVLATGVYMHTAFYRSREPRNLQTLNCFFGDKDNAEKYSGVAFPSFSISGDGQKVGFQAQALGRKAVPQTTPVALPAGANAVQKITITGGPTGGSFKLRFQGKETAAINIAGLTTGAIATALNGLSTLGAGAVVVTGTYDITFSGAAVAGVEQQAIELEVVTALTGGTTPTIGIGVTTTGGQTLFTPVPIAASHVQHFLGSSPADLVSLDLPFGYEVGFSGMFGPVFSSNQSLGNSIAALADGHSDVSASFDIMADDMATTLYNQFVSKAQKYYRWVATGPQIGASAYNHMMMIDIAGEFASAEPLKDDQGVYARNFKVNARYRPELGYAAKIVVINTVPTYAS